MNFGLFSFPAYRLSLIIIGLAAFFGLWWLIDKTKIGAIIRAGMDDKEMTMSLGLNYPLICSGIFALGAFAGGLIGTLGNPIIGVAYDMSMDIMIYAVVVTAVGGVGSITGTLLGGLLVGVIDVFVKVLFPSLANFTVYIILILMLLIRPRGIMGKSR